MVDSRIARWTKWIESRTIRGDVLTMHLQRDAWREVSEIIQRHGELPDSYWWEFMLDTYLTTQAVAVRRQADIKRGVVSLAKLIQQIRGHPQAITRDFWIGLWDVDPEDPLDSLDRAVAERTWVEEYGGGDHLDRAVPARDLDALSSASASVKRYVDKHIAHAQDPARDGLPAQAVLSVREVHDAIDVIGELFAKYSSLFTAAGYASLVPAIQHDWKAVFRQPWIRAQ
jgi:hypothetical protein